MAHTLTGKVHHDCPDALLTTVKINLKIKSLIAISGRLYELQAVKIKINKSILSIDKILFTF
ncbi:hypothetical protein BCN13_23885 [Salmonella enterica]|nr:hypothetical protein [Salmonella enterica]EAQ6819070.1 hypothetical protein [Salmonella enterica]